MWKSGRIAVASPSGPVVLPVFLTRIGEGRVISPTHGRPLDSVALFIPTVAARVQAASDTLTVSGLRCEWLLHETERGSADEFRPALDNRLTVALTADTTGRRSGLAVPAQHPRGSHATAPASAR